MKTSLRMSVVVGLTAAFVGTGAFAAEKSLNIGGSARWQITNDKSTDTVADTKDHKENSTSTKKTTDDGRIKLDIKGRIESESGAWAEAVGQPLFNMSTDGDDGAVGYDDRYVKFGRGTRWDIQLGEFEGFDLFPTGSDMAYNKADGNANYVANKARGRTNNGVAHGALHTNFGKTAFELGIMTGDNTEDKDSVSTRTKTTGIRPAIKFDSGRFSVGAGYDYKTIKTTKSGATNTDNEKWKGFGITAGTNFGRGNVNFNIASGKGTNVADGNAPRKGAAEKVKITSIGINGGIGGFGLGIIQDKFKSDNEDSSIDHLSGKQTSIYAAYKIPLMGMKDATATFGIGTSKAKYDDGDTDKDNRVRARLEYSF